MKVDVAIIGAGLAGASTAFHLSQSFRGSILILERESAPALHASGRNAGLVLQSVADPEIRKLAAAGARAYSRQAEEIGFRKTGSLLLGPRSLLELVLEPERVGIEWAEPEEVRGEIPLLAGHSFEAALRTPGDGVMDVRRLMDFYLASAQANGAEIAYRQEVQSIAAGRFFRIQTPSGTIQASRIVNAAGAWAPRIGVMCGAQSVALHSFKRHLFVLEANGRIGPDWPFVWNVEKSFYFRPEDGDVLFSLCDEEPAAGELLPTVDPELRNALAELIFRELPALGSAVQKRAWSCFRTRDPQEKPLLNWDDAVEGFLWVAGLGGHGVATSWEVGRRAAALILAV
ncbi:MAG TPA: FAD-dependent oxidoreductase [Acidobacteriota bacterium]|nr:FAD-dependent oxidoreductase [Acidobacteriota bacterium]